MNWLYEFQAWVNTTDPLWWNVLLCGLLTLGFGLLDKLMGWEP